MKEREQQTKTKLVKWAVACLIILLAAQAIVSTQQKSVTVDEIMYITAGYYHLRTGDFQMNMTNPPLMKLVSALPLLALDLELPAIEDNPKDWDLIKQWQYARSFLYHNRVDADKILFLVRLPIVAVSIILGLYVFIWSKELYGEKAGLFALFLYSFSPNILAHSRLATQDLGLAAFMFISTYYFWKYISRSTAKSLALCGIFFGMAMLTKTAASFLIPIFVIYGLIGILKKNGLGIYEKLPLMGRINQRGIRLQQLISLAFSFLLIGFLGIIVLNVGYGFQGSFRPISKEYHPAIYERLPINNAVVRWLSNLLLALPLPLPSPYVQSLIFQSSLTTNSGSVYFAGNIYDLGLWYLMIISFLIKTPLPVLMLLAVSVAYFIIQKGQLEAERLIVTFISFIMFIFSYFSNVNVGLRYVLPIYPFVHLLISRLFVLPFKRRKLIGGILTTLSIWYLLGALMIHPHYLAYFNEIIGGPKNGYKYLADSNLDWGQDLKGLKCYMEKNDIQKIKLAYFGSADAAYYGIDYDYLPSVGLAPQEPGQYWWYEIDADYKKQVAPQEGIIAVSANILASPGWLRPLFHSTYEWLRRYEPVDQVGYSILIYEID